ncbi:MAG: YraN family protein [Fimbriimonadaceae bacterium]
MKIDRRSEGRAAEDRAAIYLMSKGCTIVTRRFKCRRGELDLVMLDGDTLAFVEVKLRRGAETPPEEAVTPRKRALLHEAAREYLQKVDEPNRAYRLDLVAVDNKGIRHYPGAFSDTWDM